MKKLHRIALTLALPVALAGQPIHAGNFGGEVIVSDVNVGSQFPDIAYANGVAHVVWAGYEGAGPSIFYKRSTAPTGSFGGAPVNLSGPVPNGNDRPQVVAGGAGGQTVVVGWNSHTDTGAIYTRRSSNGGVSWQGTVLTAGAEGGFYSRITDLFIDSAGRIHLVYYTSDNTGGLVGMVHHRMSCDGGATWPVDTPVTSTSADADVDNEEAAIGEFNGRFYLAYRTSARGNPQGGWPPYTIVMKSGTVAGCGITNWTYPARHVAGGNPFTQSSSYGPRVFSDGTKLHLAWWNNTAGAETQYRGGNPQTSGLGSTATLSAFGVGHVEPGGITSTPSVATGGYESPPALVGNGATAWIAYAAQTAQDSGREYGVVKLRESADNGVTWGAEQTIATSNQGATPQMAVDTANTQNVGIVWTEIALGGSARIKYRLYTLGALSGGPSLSFSADPVAFGNRAVGATNSLPVNVLNTGGAGTISGVALVASGSNLAINSGDYQITGNTCTGAIGAGGSCTITIAFTAKALGLREVKVQVTSNDINSPTLATVSGTGVANGVGVNNNNVSAVVTGYYETILGRAPDAGGLNFWVGEANRMVGLGTSAPSVNEVFFAMSIQFFNSAEYLGRNRTDSQYIGDLYRTFFVREPDGPGQSFWQAELNALQDRSALLTNFLFSAEFNLFMSGIFGSPTVRPEINMTVDLYRGILGVLPDTGGFQFWLAQIRTAQCQGSNQVKAKVAELAGAFVNSPEYSAREGTRPTSPPADIRTRMHVSDLYNAFLRRGAESSGFNFWVATITGGHQTRDQVRASFIASPEFDARVTQVINAGCFS